MKKFTKRLTAFATLTALSTNAFGESKGNVFKKEKLFIEHFSAGDTFESNRIQLGAPPIGSKGSKLIANVGYVNDLYEFADERASYKTLSFIPVFLKDINRTWKISAVTPLSFSAEDGTRQISAGSLTFVSSLQLNRYSGIRENNFGFGLVAIKQADRTQVFPSFSVLWEDESSKWLFSAGFPKIEACRRIRNNSSFCANSSVDLATYSIDSSNSYAKNSDYLNVQRFKVGLEFTTVLLGNLFASVSGGKVLNELITVTDGDLKKNEAVGRKNSENFYTSARLSVRF